MSSKPLLLMINLKKRSDRLEKMRARLKGLDYTVIEAVPGDQLGDSIKKIKSTLSNNEKGCIASHIKALNIFLQTNHETCCILEDDVIFGNDFFSIIESDLDFPKGVYVLKLETMRNKVWIGKTIRNFGNIKSRRIFSFHYGTAAYITSRSGAKFIIQALSEFDMPADDIIFLKMLADEQYGKCYQLDPACCIQEFLLDDTNESDICEGREKRLGKDTKSILIKKKEKRLMRKIHREYKRLVKQIVFISSHLCKIMSRSYRAIDFKG